MFCPKCHEEYRDEFTRCSACDVDLVSQLPAEAVVDHESHTEFVVVRRFANEIAAAVAKTALDASGIESTLNSDDCGGEDPGLSFARGIGIVVSSDDAEMAAEILNAGDADSTAEDINPEAMD